MLVFRGLPVKTQAGVIGLPARSLPPVTSAGPAARSDEFARTSADSARPPRVSLTALAPPEMPRCNGVRPPDQQLDAAAAARGRRGRWRGVDRAQATKLGAAGSTPLLVAFHLQVAGLQQWVAVAVGRRPVVLTAALILYRLQNASAHTSNGS